MRITARRHYGAVFGVRVERGCAVLCGDPRGPWVSCSRRVLERGCCDGGGGSRVCDWSWNGEEHLQLLGG